MGIRWKFLIVVLFFSLPPLVTVIGLSQWGTIRFGNTIAALTRSVLVQCAGRELQQTAQGHAHALRIILTEQGISAPINALSTDERHALFKKTEMRSFWSRRAVSFIVDLPATGKMARPAPQVIASKVFDHTASKWEAPLTSSGEQEALSAIAAEWEAHPSGFIEFPYGGEQAVWSFARADQNLGVIIVVAHRNITNHVDSFIQAFARWQWLDTAIASTAVLLLVVTLAFWQSKALIRPFAVMAEAVQQLGQGDFTARMHIRTGDERELVAKAFNTMVPQLQDRMEIRKALDVAREIQNRLLPRKLPDIPGYDRAARSVSCDETGGDYYDFFPCSTAGCHRMGIVVGDVTGHGIGAALLMATARALIRSQAERSASLSQRIQTVNRMLTADVGDSGHFMTVFYLELDYVTNRIEWVRAGHDPALLYDPASDQFRQLSGQGITLGIDAEAVFGQFASDISTPGSILFMGTDGLWEAHDDQGAIAGKDRLRDTIRQHAHRSADAILKALLDATDQFRGDTPQEDDVTLVVLKKH
jgi:sigma-B regulation protein RsbU (phosphoserine phosphatase)